MFSYLFFVLRVNVFRAIIYVGVLYMNYPQCGDCALSASFVKECSVICPLGQLERLYNAISDKKKP